jgi:P22_AR N-terminal domain
LDEKSVIVPVEQHTISFYGQPILVVRLPDGQPGVVLRSICDNLHLSTSAQVERIGRTVAIADALVYTQVETEGGPQRMATLILRAVPFWLAGIDPKRVREEVREEVIRYQREVVDVLYTWAASSRASVATQALVPTEPVSQPTMPEADAPPELWVAFHEQMALWHRWRIEFAQWQGSVESRLEGVEELTALIPEILDRLPPETLTPAHQRQLQNFVKQLHEASGKPYALIYEDLKTAFAVPRYQDILETEWDQVVNWFRVQIQRKRGGKS